MCGKPINEQPIAQLLRYLSIKTNEYADRRRRCAMFNGKNEVCSERFEKWKRVAAKWESWQNAVIELMKESIKQ